MTLFLKFDASRNVRLIDYFIMTISNCCLIFGIPCTNTEVHPYLRNVNLFALQILHDEGQSTVETLWSEN